MKPSCKTARARTEVKNIRANIGFKEWKKQAYTPVYVQAQQLVEAFVSTEEERKQVEAKVTERPELLGAQNWQ